MLDLLEGVGMPETLGFQADLAHTYLYLMGYNAPEHALLQLGYSDEAYAAYEQMTDKLRPWTIDFHVAQNDGEVHGAGSHDKTGKHYRADDPNGKLDITDVPATGSRTPKPRHRAHLLGRMHVSQCRSGRWQHLEHHSGCHDQGQRRAVIGLWNTSVFKHSN